MMTPHKIDVAEMAEYVAGLQHVLASASTVDRTQRKNLILRGGGTYLVVRQYFTDFTKEVVYTGSDLAEAVRIYNGMG